MNSHDIKSCLKQLEGRTAEEIIVWSLNNLGPEAAASSSFQTQSVPLLHMLSRIAPETPVIFIDTGFHHPVTLEYRDELVKLLGLNLRIVDIGHLDPETVELIGLDSEESRVSGFRTPLKLDPVRKDIRGLNCLLSDNRRDQSGFGQQLEVLESKIGETVKVYPFLNWFRSDVINYIRWHQLPIHPNYERGLRKYRVQTTPEPCF